jgi:predicted acylesterase/phospholipase RssA
VISSSFTFSTFLLDHFGVAKALIDADLLPRVVAGTSAGGLVAALVCTRTDEELRSILVPELADKIRACEEPFSVWFSRFRSSGARFDTIDWARKVNRRLYMLIKYPESSSHAISHEDLSPSKKHGLGLAAS